METNYDYLGTKIEWEKRISAGENRMPAKLSRWTLSDYTRRSRWTYPTNPAPARDRTRRYHSFRMILPRCSKSTNCSRRNGRQERCNTWENKGTGGDLVPAGENENEGQEFMTSPGRRLNYSFSCRRTAFLILSRFEIFHCSLKKSEGNSAVRGHLAR